MGELGKLTVTSNSVTANVGFNSLNLFILMIEAIIFSETLALTRDTRRHGPEDGILHSYRHEGLKSDIALTGWAL
jgi:hypothetical protein